MKNFALLTALLLAFTPGNADAKRPSRGKARKAVVSKPAQEAPPLDVVAAAEEAPAPEADASSNSESAPADERETPPAPSFLPKKPASHSSKAAPKASLGGLAGLAVIADHGALRVEAVPAYGALSELNLEAQDLITHAGGNGMDAEEDIRSALKDWRPGDRLWAVALREGSPVGLETPFITPVPAAPRVANVLTRREEAAREAALEAARTGTPLDSLVYPNITVPAGEKLWIKFAQGLPSSLRAGDVVTAETAAPLAADKKLDFLAVPPGSKVWLSALSVRDEGPVRAIRLHAYKIALAGGRVYSLSALPCSIAGGGAYARITPGGTLVTAPGEGAKVSLGPDWTVQVRLLAALTLSEPESFYRAGPGLWVKEVGENTARALEITVVVSGRSADRAGLKAGDRIYSINGTATSHTGFAAALSTFYGQPGSDVTLRVQRPGEARSDTVKLQRGASWRRGYGLRLRREGDSIVAQEASPGSPAAAAGVKAGIRLLRVGDKAAVELDRAALRALLEGEDEGALEFVFEGGDGKEKSKMLTRSWYPSTVKVDAKPAPYAAKGAD